MTTIIYGSIRQIEFSIEELTGAPGFSQNFTIHSGWICKRTMFPGKKKNAPERPGLSRLCEFTTVKQVIATSDNTVNLIATLLNKPTTTVNNKFVNNG